MRFISIIAIVVFAGITLRPIVLAASDVYTVSNIEVEATASNAVHARQAAILEGHATALNRLLKRITLPEDWPRLPQLSGKNAQALAIGYSLAEERNSATRYIGRVSVRFVAPRVRALLQQNNIPFGDVQIRAALIVPVYDLPNGRRLVWENQNIWRQAWGRPDISESLTPFILPIGDIDDIVALPTRAASPENRQALFRLAKRYQAERILLAHAKLYVVHWQGEESYALGIKLHVLTQQGPEFDEQMHFSVSGSDNPVILAQRGVDDIIRMTGVAWKRRIIVHHDESSEREVEVRFRSLGEWQTLRRLLNQVAVVSNYQVQRIDNQSALLTFSYSGSPQILKLALKQKNLELIFSEDEDQPWQIKLRR